MPPRIRTESALAAVDAMGEAIPGKTALPVLASSGMSKRKLALIVLLILGSVVVAGFVSLYTFHRGFRRTCQFWTRTLPWILEYQWLKFQHTYLLQANNDWQRDFHVATAPKAVQMVQDMGGIYVKTGQALSTIGSGVLPEEYVQALQPLQNGIPPRSYETISNIIETSTGQTMEDMFVEFDERAVGAATIGQAHRAILKQPSGAAEQQVIVKVQYPEVAELLDADLSNMEWLVWLLLPASSQGIFANLRKRHERELDFREEAAHLKEVRHNMQQHGLEPHVVRIPRVRNETGLCSRHVLVMEYLEGVPLRDVMEEEQDRIARALGHSNGEELRYRIARRVREHFEQGGGGGKGTTQTKLLLGGNNRVARIWNLLGPFAIHGLRRYARVREQVVGLASRIRGKNNNNTLSSHPSTTTTTRNINLGKVLKTLMHVHAIQMMMDGVYNNDPHPGNVVVLDDGRVGLLDYGMVGRLSNEQRLYVASTVLALKQNNPKEIARLYLGSGYDIHYRGEKVTDPNVLFRIASTHFDKIDLSPIPLSEQGGINHEGNYMEMQELWENVEAVYVPDWIIQARRLGRIMMGVSAQAARPVSLSKEWEPVAQRALREWNQRRDDNCNN